MKIEEYPVIEEFPVESSIAEFPIEKTKNWITEGIRGTLADITALPYELLSLPHTPGGALYPGTQPSTYTTALQELTKPRITIPLGRGEEIQPSIADIGLIAFYGTQALGGIGQTLAYNRALRQYLGAHSAAARQEFIRTAIPTTAEVIREPRELPSTTSPHPSLPDAVTPPTLQRYITYGKLNKQTGEITQLRTAFISKQFLTEKLAKYPGYVILSETDVPPPAHPHYQYKPSHVEEIAPVKPIPKISREKIEKPVSGVPGEKIEEYPIEEVPTTGKKWRKLTKKEMEEEARIISEEWDKYEKEVITPVARGAYTEMRLVSELDKLPRVRPDIERNKVTNAKERLQRGQPVGIRIEEGKIIDGTHTIIAAKELGIKQLPVLEIKPEVTVPPTVPPIVAPETKVSLGEAVSKVNLSKYELEVAEGIKKIVSNHPELLKRKSISHSELEAIADKLTSTPILKKVLSMQEGQLAAEALKLRKGEDALIRSALQSDLLKLKDNISNVLKVRQTQAVGRVGTEIARGLEQFKMPIGAQEEIAALINKRIWEVQKDTTISRAEVNRLISSLVDLRKTVLSKDFNPTWFDKGYEFWMNNILSGPFTHTVNITSNLLFNLTKPLEKGVYAAFDIPLSWFTGKRTHYFSEIPAQLKGISKYVKGEKPPIIAAGGKYGAEFYRPPLIKGVKGKLVRLPTQWLVAEDNIAKRLIGLMEAEGRAEAIARQEGLKDIDLINRKNQLLMNPTEKLKSEVSREQLYRTFQDMTGLGEILTKLPQKGLRWFFPFRKTLSAILTRAAERGPVSPLVALSRIATQRAAYSQYQSAMDLGNMAMGLGISAALLYAFMKGRITSAPPKTKAERDLWYAQGKQPYAMQLGEQWVPYNRLEPYGTAMMMAADLYDGYIQSDKDIPPAKIMDAVGSLSVSLMNKTFLRGITTLTNAVVYPERYGEEVVANIGKGFVPAAGLMRNITSMSDQDVKDAQNLYESIIKDIPILSHKVPTRINVLGQEIKREAEGWSKFTPFPITKEKKDLVVDELIRLKYTLGYPSPMMNVLESEVKLDRDSYNRVLIAGGTTIYHVLYNVFSDPRYYMVSDSLKSKIVQSYVSSIRGAVKDKVKLEILQQVKEGVTK